MHLTNIIKICFFSVIFSGCLNLADYGVDPILKEDAVKLILKSQENALIVEYNNSKRHISPVTDIDLELQKKSWNEGRTEVEFEFSQQVRDEFGKRIGIFEERIVSLVLSRDSDNNWILIRQDFK